MSGWNFHYENVEITTKMGFSATLRWKYVVSHFNEDIPNFFFILYSPSLLFFLLYFPLWLLRFLIKMFCDNFHFTCELHRRKKNVRKKKSKIVCILGLRKLSPFSLPLRSKGNVKLAMNEQITNIDRKMMMKNNRRKSFWTYFFMVK